jgi:hypothetical protein
VSLTRKLRAGEAIDLVVTNHPQSFLEFASWLPIVYLAATPDEGLVSRFAHCVTVSKPFVNRELIEVVEKLCATPV